MPKRIMDEFTLDEISAVDRPAQKAALAAIIKSDVPATFASFEEACAHIQKRESLGELDAMQRVARDWPDLLAKFNANPVGETAVEKGRGLVADNQREARQNFEMIADGISMRENVPGHVALRLARQRNPDAYRNAYEMDKTSPR